MGRRQTGDEDGRPSRWLRRGVVVLLALLPLRPVHAASAVPALDANGVKRVLTLLSVAGEEYRESLDESGALARPLEYEEARSFLAEARLRWDGLGGLAQAGQGLAQVSQQLSDLAAAIDAKAPPTSVLTQLGAVRTQVSQATGLAEDVYPPQPPSPRRGAPIYQEYCAACHGERGNGQGAEAARLDPKPANFTDPTLMRGETPYDHFHVVTVGKRGAAMPAWEDVLTVQERWDVLSYVWRLAGDSRQLAEGQGIYLSQCASCHGGRGDGAGPYAAGLLTRVPNFAPVATLAQRTDTDLFNVVRDGVAGTAMPAFRSLHDDERWKVVAFLRALSLGGPDGGDGAIAGGGTEPTSAPPAVDAFAAIRHALDMALAAYQRHDPQALALVSDAYFAFEPLERKLTVNAPELTRGVETRFLELRGVVATPNATAQAAALIAAIGADLDALKATLAQHVNPYALFVQSATIILREGFEVVLILTALLAYVRKAGHPQMARSIRTGAAAGVGVSLVTAYAFAQVFRGASTGAAETLGGVTMLLASVVLFWVSYWLVSKAEADKWQRYIQGKVKTALSAGSGLALAGAAFLAVFREGVETVLFYQALFSGEAGATATAVSGLIAGVAALAIVYAALARFGMRIPIRPFFLGTSFLLYYMAVVFAGNGVAELQETGWISVTAVPGVPRIDWLGLYPTAETLLAQGILLALLIYAAVVILRQRAVAARSITGETDAVLVAVRGLHRLAVAIRSDLGQQQPAQAGRRLETLIERVVVLEGQMQRQLPSRCGVPHVDH